MSNADLPLVHVRFGNGDLLPGAHRMSNSRFYYGHVAGKRPISGVIVPRQASYSGRKKVIVVTSEIYIL